MESCFSFASETPPFEKQKLWALSLKPGGLMTDQQSQEEVMLVLKNLALGFTLVSLSIWKQETGAPITLTDPTILR